MAVPQKLGIKVFYYYLSKRVFVGLALLVISLIVLASQGSLVSKVAILFPSTVADTVLFYLICALFVTSFLLIAGGIFMSWFEYISCTFTMDEHSFNIRRGIFNKKEVFIPYRQVQDIDIEQTLYLRMMGVSKLVILTAGDDDKDKEGEAEGVFEVIDSDLAGKIRQDILARTNVQTVQGVI